MIDEYKVFINCPFDNLYFPLLKPLLFTIIYLDLKPQISETADSGEVRIDHIVELMKTSKYSIHDLSRVERIRRNDYPRFNMPFECGIDFGLKKSNPEIYGGKKFLILEKEPYRYKSIISDISGNDIKSHRNEPEEIIKAVRDWFKISIEDVPWYKPIWLAYAEFEFDFEQILNDKRL
ncbi:hypothetical protein [Flavobacterium sp. N1718]|uniref:hypothetical protein n=1 Tax=Flavobacterium sp. N1718 TaxID=2986822 RepID=UPI0022253A84|nr:hypothetical protein [Flavobacterium sp. N1718]